MALTTRALSRTFIDRQRIGLRRIEEQFSWRTCALRTAKLYEDVLGRGTKSPEART